MFLGEYQHSVDDKGRLVLPAKFRDRLDDGLVVTKGQEHCLYLFPMDRWEEEVAKVQALPRENKRFRNYARTFFGSASDQTLDRQGRIQVPQGLRDYAELDKDVIVVGVGERVEIWDVAAWSTLSEEADELFSGIEESLGEERV